MLDGDAQVGRWSSSGRAAAPPAELIAFGHFSKRCQERHAQLVPFDLWRSWSAALREWIGGVSPSYAVVRNAQGTRFPVIFDGVYVATVLPAKRLKRPAPVGYPLSI